MAGWKLHQSFLCTVHRPRTFLTRKPPVALKPRPLSQQGGESYVQYYCSHVAYEEEQRRQKTPLTSVSFAGLRRATDAGAGAPAERTSAAQAVVAVASSPTVAFTSAAATGRLSDAVTLTSETTPYKAFHERDGARKSRKQNVEGSKASHGRSFQVRADAMA
eukprot:SAG31_NODE_1406_length_8487_cov_4.584883_10_plen_162_part_00